MIRTFMLWAGGFAVLAGSLLTGNQCHSKDYIVVIAGGPNREQNQASMEANVLFFLDLVQKQMPADRELSVFFADGQDPGRDLQYVQSVSNRESQQAQQGPNSDPSANLKSGDQANTNELDFEPRDLRDLLGRLNRRGGRGPGGGMFSGNRQRIAYRNHQVPNAESTSPELIRKRMETIAEEAKPGDRLLIYVTAHGSSDKDSDFQNTSIACWGGEIRVKELSQWLEPLAPEVPVYHVMAQCYTGGFANLIFNRPSSDDVTLSDHAYVGFFAQQYDLPAAGCRPDVEVDEEYSSYFWGAMIGRMRNGQEIIGADLNGDGRISFGEAHAHAVAFSQTIDIPLKGSDRLLRQFSFIPDYVSESQDQFLVDAELVDSIDVKALASATGTIQETLARADTESTHIVKVLLEELNIPLYTELGDLPDFVQEHSRFQRREYRDELDRLLSLRKAQSDEASGEADQEGLSNSEGGVREARDESEMPRRRMGGRSGRRELLAAIESKFPELEPAIQGRDRSVLGEIDHQEILNQIKLLPEYRRYERSLIETELQSKMRATSEMFAVKMRRLVETLELVLLEANLKQIAAPEVVEQFQRMRLLEGGTLGGGTKLESPSR